MKTWNIMQLRNFSESGHGPVVHPDVRFRVSLAQRGHYCVTMARAFTHMLDKMEILQPKENNVRGWFICLAGASLPARVQVPFEVAALSQLTWLPLWGASLIPIVLPYIQRRTGGDLIFLWCPTFLGLTDCGRESWTTHFFSRARVVRGDWLFLGTEWNVTLGCSVTCSPSGSSPRTCGAFILSLLHYHIIYFISENTCSITTIMAALMHTRRRCVKNKIKQNMELSRKKNVKDD